MSLLVVPAELEGLLARPGRMWTKDERWQVAVWLTAPPQRARLLRYVVLHLGSRCRAITFIDAEDTWSAFCVERLDKVTRRYDPASGPFVPFLLLALRRCCWREGRQRSSQRERLALAGLGEPFPSVAAINSDDPERAIARQQASRRLHDCIAALSVDHRTVIVQHYFGGKQIREIADALGITEGATKVRLHRARRQLSLAFQHDPVTSA